MHEADLELGASEFGTWLRAEEGRTRESIGAELRPRSHLTAAVQLSSRGSVT